MLTRNLLAGATLLLGQGCLLSSCVDSSYDMSKDIDMTMGIGANGLQLNLGNTEEIMLGDLLNVDDEEMLGTDANNLFYLTKEGEATFDVTVDPVQMKINKATLRPTIEVAAGVSGWVNEGTVLVDGMPATADDDFTFQTESIGDDVKSIRSVIPNAKSRFFTMKLKVDNNKNVAIKKVENLKVTFPDFVKCVGGQTFEKGNLNNEYLTNDIDVGTVNIDRFVCLNDKGEIEENPVVNGALQREIAGKVVMEGKFTLVATNGTSISSNDPIEISMEIMLGGTQNAQGTHVYVDLDKVEGRYCPIINPEVDPVDIASDLPDFLTDEEVEIRVQNPTIRFDIDMQNVDAGLDFSGYLTSEYDNGNPNVRVRLPKAGEFAKLTENKNNTVYFYKSGAPYEPEEDFMAKQEYKGRGEHAVPDLDKLIVQLPNQIDINLKNNQVKVQDKLYTIELGKRYQADLKYNVLIPFQFDRGLCIVYNDEADDMNGDLKDYTAEGADILATIENTIPLDLIAELTAKDVDGNPIPSIEITKQSVPANAVTDVVFKMICHNPADFSKLDKLTFKIKGKAEDATGELMSNQSLQVKNMRIKLTGQVVGNFN